MPSYLKPSLPCEVLVFYNLFVSFSCIFFFGFNNLGWLFIRSEQDKEPEPEVVSEAVGSSPVEETAADSMFSLSWTVVVYWKVFIVEAYLTRQSEPGITIMICLPTLRSWFLYDHLFLVWHICSLSVPQEIDEYELVDPVDILTPLEKSGFWEGVVSKFCSIICN